MLGADRSAQEDRYIGESFALIRRQDISAEQLPDASPQRTIEDVAEGPAVAAVLRHEKDALEKSRLLQTRISQYEVAFERTLGGILGWRWHEEGEM